MKFNIQLRPAPDGRCVLNGVEGPEGTSTVATLRSMFPETPVSPENICSQYYTGMYTVELPISEEVAVTHKICVYKNSHVILWHGRPLGWNQSRAYLCIDGHVEDDNSVVTYWNVDRAKILARLFELNLPARVCLNDDGVIVAYPPAE